jgi:hypothetical protein
MVGYASLTHPTQFVVPIDFSNSATRSIAPRSRGRLVPRVMRQACPSHREGAGKAGHLLIPMVRVQKKKHAAEPQVQPDTGLPCAMVLRLIRNLLGDHAWLPPSSARRLKRLHELSACIGAPGPYDFAVRHSLIRPRKDCACGCRVHRIPLPTSVTIAKRPSCGNGMAVVVNLIWGHREAIYFRAKGWTGFRSGGVICPSCSHTMHRTPTCRELVGIST